MEAVENKWSPVLSAVEYSLGAVHCLVFVIHSVRSDRLESGSFNLW